MELGEITMVSEAIDYLDYLAKPNTSTSELTMLSQYIVLLKSNQLEICDMLLQMNSDLEKLKAIIGEKECNNGY